MMKMLAASLFLVAVAVSGQEYCTVTSDDVEEAPDRAGSALLQKRGRKQEKEDIIEDTSNELQSRREVGSRANATDGSSKGDWRDDWKDLGRCHGEWAEKPCGGTPEFPFKGKETDRPFYCCNKKEPRRGQKAVLFLTDGVAPFTSANYYSVKHQAIKYDTYIFTYALGSDAQKDITKKLACENRGVFYSVTDEQDLADVMIRYFNYFAQGQEICNAAVTKYVTTGNTQVYGSCLPMYNRTKPFRELLGVACTDVNLVADVPAMQQKAGWNYFVCAASDTTKMCKSLDLTECHRQRIRLSYSQDSVCTGAYSSVTSDTKCPCQDPSCQDDPEFTDQKGYFCDTWIGDDCTDVDGKWDYSAEGLDEIRRFCPRSCGLCAWKNPCPYADAGDCKVLNMGDKCRACVGKTSGVDIEQRDMACPGDSPDNPIHTTTDKPIFVGSAGIVATSLPLVVALLAIARV